MTSRVLFTAVESFGGPQEAEITVFQSYVTWVRQGLAKGRNQDLSSKHIYRAPEVIFEMPWGSAIDIWNLACLVSQVLPVLRVTAMLC